MKIKISKEDAEFLKDLQHELNTQENDGNADPVFWGVMEDYEALNFDGEGEVRIPHDDGAYDLEELVGEINSDCCYYFNASLKDKWAHVDKSDINDVMDFVNKNCNQDHYFGKPYWVEIKQRLSRQTGAFLTKRAAKEYVEKYSYNHRNPHTYAMTAFRNFELERLLNILKTMEIVEEQI